MQLTLSSHTEQLLRQAMAREPTQSADQILEQALAERLERETAATLPIPKHMPAPAFEAALDRLAQFSDRIPPPQPEETFSREMIYQDHD